MTVDSYRWDAYDPMANRTKAYSRLQPDLTDELLQTYVDDGWGLVAVLRVFGDETGNHRGAPITAVAIYFAHPANWRQFKKPWRKRLKKLTGSESFHMFDFEHGLNAFEGWDETQKTKLRDALFPLIPKYAERGMSCAVLDPEILREAKELQSIRREFHRDEIPYLWCMTRLVKTLGSGLTGKWANERITFVFAKNQYSDIARHCYDWIKYNAPYGERLAGTIAFAPIEEHPGLEAADILAFETYKLLDDWRQKKGAPQRPAIEILNRDKTVIILPYPPVRSIRLEMRALANQVREFRRVADHRN